MMFQRKPVEAFDFADFERVVGGASVFRGYALTRESPVAFYLSAGDGGGMYFTTDDMLIVGHDGALSVRDAGHFMAEFEPMLDV